MQDKQSKQIQGLTLLEVMVALLIIGIVLLSLIKVSALQANYLRYLEQKNQAQWVALDIVNKLQVGVIPFPTQLDSVNGQENQLGTDWYWTINFESTGDPHAFKATVAVKTSETGTSLVRFITYISPTTNQTNNSG
jgi:type II secretion system protein I